MRHRSLFLSGIAPGMLQTFDELPERAIQRRGHSEFFAGISDGAVHEIDFRLALGENILQHAGFVLAGSIGTFLDKRARIAVELDAESLGNSFAFRDQCVKERSGFRKASGSAVME